MYECQQGVGLPVVAFVVGQLVPAVPVHVLVAHVAVAQRVQPDTADRAGATSASAAHVAGAVEHGELAAVADAPGTLGTAGAAILAPSQHFAEVALVLRRQISEGAHVSTHLRSSDVSVNFDWN